MKTRTAIFTTITSLLLTLISSCSPKVENKVHNINFTKQHFIFQFEGSDSIQLTYTIKYRERNLYQKSLFVTNDSSYTLNKATLGMLRKEMYEISYEIASKDSFPIHYVLQNDTTLLCDTIIYYKKIPTMINDSIYAHIESNNYAGLRRATYKSHIKDAKSYLLSNHKKADTVTIEKMAKYIFYLSTNNIAIYKNDKKIPTYRQLPSTSEIIRTNMDADYFYFIGVEKEEKLKDFINNEIINDFTHGKSNDLQGEKKLQLIPINTGFDVIRGNYLYLFLCGINKDWSYKYIPIGGVVIDNIPPSLFLESNFNLLNNTNTDNYAPMAKFNNYYIDFNSTNSIRTNITSFKWGNFEGDNYFGYSIPFTVKFNAFSDLNEIVIQGKSKKVSTEIDIRNLMDGNIFRFEHHFRKLNTGDNYIKVDFIDVRGNKSTTTINIKTQRIKDNDTEINNNIYNNIYH